jgi:hypothetical protein
MTTDWRWNAVGTTNLRWNRRFADPIYSPLAQARVMNVTSDHYGPYTARPALPRCAHCGGPPGDPQAACPEPFHQLDQEEE